jgi:peptidyl-tRNA hydrolase
MDLAEYVLSPFAEEEHSCVDAMILQAVRAVSFAIESGFDAAMNTFNTVIQPPEAVQTKG